MAEETPAPTQTPPTDQLPAQLPTQPPAQPPAKKKKGGFFEKIPRDILFSPGGAVLLTFSLFMEGLDWIPIPILDSFTWELVLELIFIVLLVLIARVSFKGLIIPFIIERLPGISDILPSWFLKLFL